MVLATDFTYQLGTSGFVLNSDVSLPFVDVTNVKGLDSAPVRTSIRDRDGHEGGYVDSKYSQARTLAITGTLYDAASDVELILDRFKEEWAPSEVPIPLYFRHPSAGNRLLWVYPQGVNYDVDASRRLGITELVFNAVAGDPRIYAESLTTISMFIANSIQTGFAFSLSFPFGFGGVTPVASPPTIVNVGNRSTPVKFRMYGPYINPHVVNQTTGDEMAFDLLVDNASDYLEVDTDARTVRYFSAVYGSYNLRPALRRPSWFDLVKGNNTIAFNVEGGSTTSTHMDVIYRAAWR
jgi:hypothetical protein